MPLSSFGGEGQPENYLLNDLPKSKKKKKKKPEKIGAFSHVSNNLENFTA